MAKKGNFLRRNSISLFIGFIILLILASSTTAFYSRLGAAQHQEKKDALLKVRETLDRIWSHITRADMGFRGYALIQEERYLGPYKGALEKHEQDLDSLSYYLLQQDYPEERLMADNEKAIKDYISLVGEMIDLTRQGRKEEALSILAGNPRYNIWLIYNAFNTDAIDYISQLQIDAQQQYDTVQRYTTIVQAALLIIGIPILVLVILRLTREGRVRRQLLGQLDNSNREFVYNDGHARSGEEAEQIIGYLTQNLEKVTSFIRNLGSGQSEWTELSNTQRELNENTLVGELLKMQEKLDQIKQEDELRLWATEGEGKVAEIARTHQTDLSTLGDELLAYIVRYASANQGGLFIASEETSNPHLEMVACYAYDTKKYEEKIIKPGQGLLGQAFVEQKTIRLTQIPENYVRITSGLGEATPSYLVIIPLKFNEEVLGVLEIASFQELSTFKVDFLEKISEIVASSISVVRTTQRTHGLLEESKQQAEELQAQEEEMRQNMEELQATQEAAHRDQEKVQAIFDSASDGIIVLTDQEHVEMFNPAAEEMFGYSADEVQNQSFDKLLASPADKNVGTQSDTALIVGELQTVEARRKNGDVFLAELKMQESEVGKQRMFIGVIRDLTQDERQRTNEELMRSRIKEVEQKAYDRLVKLREKFKGEIAERDRQIEVLQTNLTESRSKSK
ncbi:PAS domain S-box protein [Tunicatimonas pelagia]|uniref:PAS domain S-box protein n=1 Tax=Tunicatimonas pelagia TaxID=931531 RepID=UPI0026652B53|nr:PAS domain S-box protein [Tunicatimonas pelagia]WKN40665.1 PAS domain S-box protein [Tunicatimonas pelagia]